MNLNVKNFVHIVDCHVLIVDYIQVKLNKKLVVLTHVDNLSKNLIILANIVTHPFSHTKNNNFVLDLA